MDYKISESPNPYIFNLEKSLSSNYLIINNNLNRLGVLDLFKYIIKTDIFLFNWIEYLYSRRYGKSQIVLFSIFIIKAKLLKKKIVWILHDRYSHENAKNIWIDYMFGIMMKYSDLIITHSNGGIDLTREKFPKQIRKTRFIIHPVQRIVAETSSNTVISYDFLIWGVIFPYKGVLEFLKYIHESKVMDSFKILIVGKCIDKTYKLKINNYLNNNICHQDDYYSIDEIARFAARSRFTLFTYLPETVLSSGSFMDSIGMGSLIIGPNVGAFKDLNSLNFVWTYNSYSDIIDIYNTCKESKESIRAEIEKFCHENSWENFSQKIYMELMKLYGT